MQLKGIDGKDPSWTKQNVSFHGELNSYMGFH